MFEPLQKAQKTQMFFLKDGVLHIQSFSTGCSVIILPIEYSNCLRTLERNHSDFKLFRADLLLTGIIFKETLDIKIQYSTGPFCNAYCRLKDFSEMKKIGIKSVS